MKWTVILRKGPDRREGRWEHDLEWTARRRARALSELHGDCLVVEFEATQELIVQAEGWYHRKGGDSRA